MMLPWIWLLAASPAVVVDSATELAPAAQAWSKALQGRGLELTVSPEALLKDDHVALPASLTLPFRGLVIMGFQEAQLSGELRITRQAPGFSHAELEFTGPKRLSPRAEARLLKHLQRDLQASLEEAEAPALTPDPLLADPGRCRERVQAFASSPFPEAQTLLRGSLDQVAPSCRRALLSHLLQDPQNRAALVTWLELGYKQAPDAEKPLWAALILQVPDLPPELEDLLDQEERRQQTPPASAP